MIGCDPSGDVPWVCEISSVRVTYRQGTYQGIRDCRENDLPTTPESSYLSGGGGGRPTAARGIGGTTPNTKRPTRDRNPFSARQLRQNNRYYIHHKSSQTSTTERSGRNLFCFHFPSAPNFGPRNIFNKMMEFSTVLLRFSLRRLSALLWLVETRGPICGSWTLLRKIIYVDDKLLTPSVHRKL